MEGWYKLYRERMRDIDPWQTGQDVLNNIPNPFLFRAAEL